MERLVAGVKRFQTEVVPEKQALFTRLAKGQSPRTLFITCSDSRIDPSLITQSDPGDLFVIRNAGNIVPPYNAANGGEGATIEYAVVALGVNEIVVCGHSDCGAMKGLLHPEAVKHLPQVSAWLGQAEAARRIVVDRSAEGEGKSDCMEEVIQQNVLVQLDNLRTHPAVASAVARGQLRLYGWVYHIGSGTVNEYDETSKRFVPLTAGYA